MSSGKAGRDPTPPPVREEVLERDDHECQVCGKSGPESGGTAVLHVHHKDPDPDPGEVERHDLSNLITLCKDCHSWTHKQPTGEQLPVTITEADRHVLLPHDYQILEVLHKIGPLTTGEIQEELSLDLTLIAIRERLWLLMGLDQEVPSRDNSLLDQDVKTGEWGLPGQIEDSERGRIPDDMQTLIRRVHDERVRRALARGHSRATVAEVFGIAERTTWYKQRRAQAYDFPLEGLERRGKSRVPSDEDTTAGTDETPDASSTDRSQHEVAADDDGSHDDVSTVADGGEDTIDGITEDSAGLQVQVENAIAALKSLRTALDDST
jgi:hypothetical protein